MPPGFYFIWNSFIYYYLLSGFHNLLVEGVIGKNGSSPKDRRFYKTAYALIIFASISLFFLLLGFCFLQKLIYQFIKSYVSLKIYFNSFKEPFEISINQFNVIKKKEKKDVIEKKLKKEKKEV